MTKARGSRSWLAALPLSVLVAAGSGCVATVSYQPRTGVLDELGPIEAERQLGEIIARAVEPRIANVTVNDASYTVIWLDTIHGPYGIPIGDQERINQIHFANVSRVELYENDYVYIYGHGDRFLHKLLFGNRQDATGFIDLLCALRDRRSLRDPRGGY